MSLPILALLIGGSALAILGGDESDAADVVVGYFSGITAWIVGDTMRTQRERAAWMAARRVEEVKQVATEERLAIARDLHDIVAHNVSVIAVQAEGARSIVASDPERAGHAMDDVAETARTALAELRQLLGVLRSEDVRAPQPGLDGDRRARGERERRRDGRRALTCRRRSGRRRRRAHGVSGRAGSAHQRVEARGPVRDQRCIWTSAPMHSS